MTHKITRTCEWASNWIHSFHYRHYGVRHVSIKRGEAQEIRFHPYQLS